MKKSILWRYPRSTINVERGSWLWSTSEGCPVDAVVFVACRCGMIYMEPMQLGWEPLIKSWMNVALPSVFTDDQRETVQVCLFHLGCKLTHCLYHNYMVSMYSNLLMYGLFVFRCCLTGCWLLAYNLYPNIASILSNVTQCTWPWACWPCMPAWWMKSSKWSTS